MDDLDLGYMIAVMQAAKEGKKIESKRNLLTDPSSKWSDCDNPWWDWVHNDYRVKDEPAGPIRLIGLKDKAHPILSAWTDKHAAGVNTCVDLYNCEAVEFIELTPEVREKLGL